MTVPAYLHHHTTAEKLVKLILPTGMMRFSPFAEVNDPRELKEWSFGLGSVLRGQGRAETTEEILAEETAANLRTTSKVLCLSRDDDRKTGYNTDKLHYWGFCRPRMWAQYADKHRGACLVLGYTELDEAIGAALGGRGLLFKGKVAYHDWSMSRSLRNRAFIIDADLARQQGPTAAVQAHLQRHWKDLFFEKTEDWRDEREYRWVFNDGKPDATCVPIWNVIKAIVLGSDFQQDQWRDPYHFKKEYDVESAKLSWRNGIPFMLPPFGGPWT